MVSLTKVDKNKLQVVYATVIVALLIQRACRLVGLTDDQMPAVQQCTVLLGEVLDPLPTGVRTSMLNKINKKRVALTAKVNKLDAPSSLAGAIDVLTGKYFKSRPGTRFDFIRQTLRENRGMFVQTMPIKDEDRRKFAALFTASIFEK